MVGRYVLLALFLGVCITVGNHYAYVTKAAPSRETLTAARPIQVEDATKEENSVNLAGITGPPAVAPAERAYADGRGGNQASHRIAKSESCRRLEELIKKYAARYGVDEELVWVVIRHESGFDPAAVSRQGAMGLMQLMPGTAALLGVKDPFNIEQNIQGGIKYLEMCLARFDQDVGLALAAYNAGPENVAKYQGVPPFPETINYVNVVLKDYAAGTPHRGLRIGPRGAVMADEAATPEAPAGLNWQVPLARWKVAAPQVNVSGPVWKIPRKLVMSSAR
jgi:hypothetical protein